MHGLVAEISCTGRLRKVMASSPCPVTQVASSQEVLHSISTSQDDRFTVVTLIPQYALMVVTCPTKCVDAALPEHVRFDRVRPCVRARDVGGWGPPHRPLARHSPAGRPWPPRRSAGPAGCRAWQRRPRSALYRPPALLGAAPHDPPNPHPEPQMPRSRTTRSYESLTSDASPDCVFRTADTLRRATTPQNRREALLELPFCMFEPHATLTRTTCVIGRIKGRPWIAVLELPFCMCLGKATGMARYQTGNLQM